MATCITPLKNLSDGRARAWYEWAKRIIPSGLFWSSGKVLSLRFTMIPVSLDRWIDPHSENCPTYEIVFTALRFAINNARLLTQKSIHWFHSSQTIYSINRELSEYGCSTGFRNVMRIRDFQATRKGLAVRDSISAVLINWLGIKVLIL